MRHFARLLKSLRELGFAKGSQLYWLYLYHRLVGSKKWSIRETRISDRFGPVWMRPGVSDWIVMERIFLDHEYATLSPLHDAEMDKLLADILKRGKKPLIIDCGANIGLASVWLLQRFPGATVVAIEPEPTNFEILARTAKNFPDLKPVNAAVSDRAARVTLSNDGNTPWAWKTSETETGGIATTTIATVIKTDERYELLAVKVDIEGFEVNLFRDGANWVDETPMLVFEMHDWLTPWAGSGHSFFSALARRKRDYLVRGENVFSFSHARLRPNNDALAIAAHPELSAHTTLERAIART